ncbi:hypothetical protein [Pantoea sp. PNT03]|jgi:hypothetical protein|uniref:hypothetical protein n=1 Tax=Pantoea sp. PNT03 TaxID=2769258 RepID=UPI00177F1276|nr:hypothetical protein [Pantoea sp. PNT03]MBD9659198.1 hypothetical protein [Pantoea sp. PNT03]
MGKKVVAAWFFLLLSVVACAQPSSLITLTLQHDRHLKIENSTADVAETPDEHIKEGIYEVGQRH